MNLSTDASTITYDIWLEVQPDGTHQASVLGWADCRVVATTAAEAIEAVKTKMRDRLASGQIVRVELHSVPADNPAPSSYQHPWMQFAERLKNNPLLEEVDQYIAESRRKLDENQEAVS